MGHGYQDTPLTHCMCATLASANAAIVTCPVDVIKTRTMSNQSSALALSYKDMIQQIYAKEGLRAFYNGIDALFVRLSCWNCLMFMALEQIKKAFYDAQLE